MYREGGIVSWINIGVASAPLGIATLVAPICNPPPRRPMSDDVDAPVLLGHSTSVGSELWLSDVGFGAVARGSPHDAASERAARENRNFFGRPNIRDELRYANRQDLMQDTARDTLTIRNNPSQEALPMRRLGSFLPGTDVGGAGVHWNGQTFRFLPTDFTPSVKMLLSPGAYAQIVGEG